MKEHDTGFVYVMTNRAMPEMVKIGFSTVLPEDRATALSSKTGVPLPFEVSFRALTMRWHAVEKLVHQRLNGERVNPQREFFNVSVATATQTVHECLLDINGINAWKTGVLSRPILLVASIVLRLL